MRWSVDLVMSLMLLYNLIRIMQKKVPKIYKLFFIKLAIWAFVHEQFIYRKVKISDICQYNYLCCFCLSFQVTAVVSRSAWATWWRWWVIKSRASIYAPSWSGTTLKRTCWTDSSRMSTIRSTSSARTSPKIQNSRTASTSLASPKEASSGEVTFF